MLRLEGWAMSSGYSWAPIPSEANISERGKRPGVALTILHPVGWWASPLTVETSTLRSGYGRDTKKV